jgi:beta-glucanase (GH16 family)
MFVGIFGLFFSIVSLHAGNVLNSPGFEANPAGTNQPIYGWQSYGANVYAQNGAPVQTGSTYLKVYGGFTGADNYSGVFQDAASGPGAVYSADGWAFSASGDAIRGQDQFWFEVTFRDQSANTLALYRSDIITSNNIAAFGGLSAWFNLRVTNQWAFYNSGGNPVGTTITNQVSTLVAPAGTMFVRYQIVFHQGLDQASGSTYFDDCTLNQLSGPTGPPPLAWNIVWSDEFNGSSINTNIWSFEGGNNNGWGNQELEFYTNRSQNAYVSNGLLHIVALRETNGLNYTSARMKTEGAFSKTYGRFEFRAKLPPGLGFWPALWLLGTNISSVGWPACGEIDIMENKGSILTTVQGTIHYSDALNNHQQSTGHFYSANNGTVTNFHNYMLEWRTNQVRWLVDGVVYETQTNWSSSTGPYPAPFNMPFFIIMNLAVGGSYLGNPSVSNINANTVFPGDMQVDYVRVWDLTPPLQLSLTRSNNNVVLSWPAGILCHLQSQTNTLGSGAWADVPGASNPYITPPSGRVSVFYRLQSP